MTGSFVANSANGKFVTMISSIACTTGVALTIPASAHATVLPRISYVALPVGNRSVTAATHPAWSELQSDLQRWKSLPVDWDGDNGIAPPAASVAAASTILAKLRAAHVCPPEASVSGDGEIAYNWTGAKNFVSIALLADGHLVAYGRVAGHQTVEIDEPFSGEINLVPLFESLRDFA